MKIIDLLNKIANKEEVPKKIKYNNYIYWYDKKMEDYKNSQVDYNSYIISCKYHNIDFLNDEVEIIEDTPKEDKKIPEKLDYCEENTFMEQKETTYLSQEERRLLDSNFKELGNKINSIIDYLKSKGE